MRTRWIRIIASLAVGGAVIAGCGSDDDTATPSSESSTTTEAEAAGDTVEVTLADYEFEDLPAAVDSGTTFTVRNDSETELHEFVAFRLPDDEERSVEDLVKLPEAELGALFTGGPATVLLAEPGSDETIPAVGTGTIDEPGRYVIACFIPQGADPKEYMDAAAASEGGPPDVEGGPPHFVLGMYGELLVQ